MCSMIRLLFCQIWIIFFTAIYQSLMVQTYPNSIKKSIFQRKFQIKLQGNSSNNIKLESFTQYLINLYNLEKDNLTILSVIERWRKFVEDFDTLLLSKMNKTISKPIIPETKKLIRKRHHGNAIYKNSIVLKRQLSKLRFDKNEKQKALEEEYELKKSNFGVCKPQNQTFCMKRFFSLKPGSEYIVLFRPAVLPVQRCPKDNCQCTNKNEKCLPTTIQKKLHYVVVDDKSGQEYTYALYLSQHVGCTCKPKCLNRKCVEPFFKRDKNGSCKCLCPRHKRNECEQVLQGRKKFSKSDYHCIVSGNCLTPDCLNQPLSEESLYNKMCPK